MKFTLSQKTKDFFDVVRTIASYLTILSIGLGMVTYSLDKEIINNIFSDYKYATITIGVIVCTFPFIAPWIHDKINSYILKKRKLSDFVIESQQIIVDITSGGRNTSHYEKIVLCNTTRKKYIDFKTELEVDGTIEEITSLNCMYNINPEKNRVNISYVNNISKLNNYPSLIKGQDKYLIFAATLKDTFVKKEEYWDVIPIHYCISYNLTILLPIESSLKTAKIYKVNEDNQVETELTEITPILTKENGRQKILMNIVDFDYAERLRLRWVIY